MLSKYIVTQYRTTHLNHQQTVLIVRLRPIIPVQRLFVIIIIAVFGQPLGRALGTTCRLSVVCLSSVTHVLWLNRRSYGVGDGTDKIGR